MVFTRSFWPHCWRFGTNDFEVVVKVMIIMEAIEAILMKKNKKGATILIGVRKSNKKKRQSSGRERVRRGAQGLVWRGYRGPDTNPGDKILNY
jgi:hypothetical protein